MGRHPGTAIARRKETSSRLSPKKQGLLYARDMDPEVAHKVMDAVKCGGSHKMAAEAGGLTPGELKYIFDLAEEGHPAYRAFRDEYFHHRSMRVITIVEAQVVKALSDDGTIADRRYVLELIEPETFKEAKVSHQAGPGAFQANQFTFNVKTSWDDESSPEPDVVDAEVVDEGE